MNKLDAQHLAMYVFIGVIKSMAMNSETRHLKTLTPEHASVAIEGIEQVINILKENIETTKKNYNLEEGNKNG